MCRIDIELICKISQTSEASRSYKVSGVINIVETC